MPKPSEQVSPSDGRDMAPLRTVTVHARERPDARALIGERTLTYGQLDSRARRLASVIAAMGAGPGSPVAIVAPNSVEHFEVAIAAAMAGAPFLPVNAHLKAEELAYLLGDAGVGTVVAHASTAPQVAAALDGLNADPSSVLVFGGGDPALDAYETAIAAAQSDPLLDSGPGPELVFYTSGTTSRPKGVIHGGLGNVDARRAGMEGQAALWRWSQDDVYILSGPAYHASHAGWGLTSLYVGATTVILDRFRARGWLEAVAHHRGTRSFMVPAHFIRLLEIPENERGAFDVSSLHLIVHAAAPCPVAVKSAMIAAFPSAEVHELYGASEGGATRISPDEWLERPGSVGLPWPGVEIRILDEEGFEVPCGSDGVVWIRPPATQRFVYRNDRRATERAWRDDAFSVGDVGHLDDDGYLYITDRISDMILWGGVNVAPREIEEVLFQHPGVVDCAVFGIPDERDGEHIKAVVEVRAKGGAGGGTGGTEGVGAGELADFVRARLADFKVPHDWEIVDELTRDASGKVVKRLLRQRHIEKFQVRGD